MATPSADLRKKQLAAIHAGKKKLGLDDDTYRGILHHLFGVDSSAKLDSDQRAQLLEHFRTRGFERSRDRVRINPDEDTLQVQLIKGLWLKLVAVKAAKSDETAALNAWVKRQTAVSHVHFLTPEQAAVVIESLKAWLNRLRPLRPAA